MPNKFLAKKCDPVNYETVKKRQDVLKAKCKGVLRISRICPYCNHRIDDVAKGDHGYAFMKCPNCGEEIVFPPIRFGSVGR